MSQITPNIYIGGFDEASNYRWLKDHGITHIVNMAIEHPNYFPRAFRYIKLGIFDHPKQSLFPEVAAGLRFMKNAIARGGLVFVHCHAGVSRSSSMVLYYLMKTYGWSLKKSLAYMRDLHPRTNPNPGFQRQLQK